MGAKIINDPLYGFVRVPSGLVLSVLSHRYVQRLVRIRQLGLSYYVFPGAVHSRFLHSLGCMHLMQLGLRVLRERGVSVSSSEWEGCCCAALLHDVGHGPFSHVLEGVLYGGLSHEALGLRLMRSMDAELGGALGVAMSIFDDSYERGFFHQLLSSQLDVDRLDYLCRDSYFCGAVEGTVASARLLSMLHVVDGRLVVAQKGLYCVEEFLLARRWMFWQVYLHKTSVGAERLLVHILRRARELFLSGVRLECSASLAYFLGGDRGVEDDFLEAFSLLDDSDILTAVKGWTRCGDVVLSELSSCFIHRRLFKVRALSGALSDEERDGLVRRYMEYFGVSASEATYFFSEHTLQNSIYSEAKGAPIHILSDDGRVRDVADCSEVLDLRSRGEVLQKRYLFFYEID